MLLKYAHIKYPVTFLCQLLLAGAYAQDTTRMVSNADSIPQQDSCVVKDATEYVRKWAEIKTERQSKAVIILYSAVIGSTPSTGFLFGVALQALFIAQFQYVCFPGKCAIHHKKNS
jgi:hypothetical protein